MLCVCGVYCCFVLLFTFLSHTNHALLTPNNKSLKNKQQQNKQRQKQQQTKILLLVILINDMILLLFSTNDKVLSFISTNGMHDCVLFLKKQQIIEKK